MFSFSRSHKHRLSLPTPTRSHGGSSITSPAGHLQQPSEPAVSPYELAGTQVEQPPLVPQQVDGQQIFAGAADEHVAGLTDAWVSQEQYQNVLKNFRVAHAMIEAQREQLKESEHQVALKTRIIAQLEGDGVGQRGERIGVAGGSRSPTTADDFSIKTAASALSSVINRYAASLVQHHAELLPAMRAAVLADNLGPPAQHPDASPLRVQSLLRHAIGEVVCSGVVNVLLVTDSVEANEQFTRVHDNLFARDALVASVWRRQTFSAAIESFSAALQLSTLSEHMPSLLEVLAETQQPRASAAAAAAAGEKTAPPTEQADGQAAIPPELKEILDQAWDFARVVHAARPSNAVNKEAFYRAFMPDLGSALDPTQIELVKRCHRTEHGQAEVVGACLFPGLVKVAKEEPRGGGGERSEVQTVVRRAQVVCACALLPKTPGQAPPPPLPVETPASPRGAPEGGQGRAGSARDAARGSGRAAAMAVRTGGRARSFTTPGGGGPNERLVNSESGREEQRFGFHAVGGT